MRNIFKKLVKGKAVIDGTDPILRRVLSCVVAATMVLTIVAAPGCQSRSGKKEKEAIVPAVTVVTVPRGTVSRSIQLLGVLQGEEQVLVYSKITGRVTEITKPEGSVVGPDEPIGYVVNDIPGMDYKPGPVRSPIAGVVGKVYVEVGQTVAPTMPFAAVARFSDRIKMKALVSETDLPFVKPGLKARVFFSAAGESAFSGVVTRVAPMLDPMSRSATVEISIPNYRRSLVPGMAGMARLVVEEKKDVVMVPLAALFATGEERVVVVRDGIAHLQPVRFGLRGDEWVEVIEGLEPGEKVATTGKEGVKEGQKVNPVEAGGQ
ncbi:efflux RND transporter periplasmic adaptor subunit [candidate division WOR-3 bacterium]|nr:efflux RND transporter periplasmic adaptor subunit [candidate division WOR-3 bacterium]